MGSDFDSLFDGSDSNDNFDFGGSTSGFDTGDSFGGDSFSGGDSFNSDFGSDNPGSNSSTFGSGSFELGGNGPSPAGNIDDFSEDNSGSGNQELAGTRKSAIIIGVVGVAVFIIAFIVGAKLLAPKTETQAQQTAQQVSTTASIQQSAQQGTQTPSDVSNVVGTKHSSDSTEASKQNSNSIVNVKDGQFTWTEISESENITWNEEESSLEFTITGINHYARSVDVNNNLIIKSTLTGSIAGLSGTYTIDIPYYKGTRVHVGDHFNVNVMLGDFNGKTVVGDISY